MARARQVRAPPPPPPLGERGLSPTGLSSRDGARAGAYFFFGPLFWFSLRELGSGKGNGNLRNREFCRWVPPLRKFSAPVLDHA